MPDETPECNDVPVTATSRPRMMINTISLASSTIITSGLGVVFWALAARMYEPSDVGLANAQISGATLAAAFASLNLSNFLLLHLPRAGKKTRWLLGRSYGISILLSVIVAVVIAFTPLQSNFMPDTFSIIVFIVAVPALAVFVQQDAALLAMGAGPAVAVENSIFAVLKIALLPLFAAVATSSGIFASWIVATVVCVLGVSVYISRRLIEPHSQMPDSVELPPRRELLPQAGKLYWAFLAGQALNLAMPLIIVHRLGTTEGGYFTMPWLVFVSVGALLTAINQSFQQDVKRGHPITKPGLTRYLGLQAAVGIGGGIAIIVLAPLIMRILAPGYAEYSVTLLRIIGLCAPFEALWFVLYAFLFLENRVGWIAAGGTVAAGISLVMAWLLAPSVGIDAAGWGLLAGSGVMAIVAVVPLIRRFRHVRAGYGADWSDPEIQAPLYR